jgi:hypothetical protein
MVAATKPYTNPSLDKGPHKKFVLSPPPFCVELIPYPAPPEDRRV